MLIIASEERRGIFGEHLLCARAHAGITGLPSILLEASASEPSCSVIRIVTKMYHLKAQDAWVRFEFQVNKK